MSTINLAPATQSLSILRRRQRRLFGLSAVLIVLLLVAGAALFILNQTADRQLEEAKTQLQTVTTEIARLGSDVERITLFEERLKSVEQLVETQLTVIPILQEIERLLPSSVTLKLLRADTSTGQVELRGLTANVDEVAQTLASLGNQPERATGFENVSFSIIHEEQAAVVPDQPAPPIHYEFQSKMHFKSAAPSPSPVP